MRQQFLRLYGLALLGIHAIVQYRLDYLAYRAVARALRILQKPRSELHALVVDGLVRLLAGDYSKMPEFVQRRFHRLARLEEFGIEIHLLCFRIHKPVYLFALLQRLASALRQHLVEAVEVIHDFGRESALAQMLDQRLALGFHPLGRIRLMPLETYVLLDRLPERPGRIVVETDLQPMRRGVCLDLRHERSRLLDPRRLEVRRSQPVHRYRVRRSVDRKPRFRMRQARECAVLALDRSQLCGLVDRGALRRLVKRLRSFRVALACAIARLIQSSLHLA